MMAQTILIVEDNDLNMKFFNDILNSAGYETIQSTDGRNVLTIVKERRPGLIIMDIQLPVQSGVELTQMLKSKGELQHIPIIAVTAFAKKYNEETIRDAGCDAYIEKPISVPVFLETVAKHLS